MEQDKQQQVVMQSSPVPPSMRSFSRTLPRKVIAPIHEQIPPKPTKSRNPIHFSNPSELSFSAIRKFPIGGQQQPMKPKRNVLRM